MIIQNKITGEMYERKTKKEALELAARLNRSSKAHPIFVLYRNGKPIAELHRDFGESELYWKPVSRVK